MIHVVVPTIQGRIDHYERCIAGYQSRTDDKINLITIRDEKTCGLAWQKGASLAGDDPKHYLHFSADDLEPLEGWDIKARECVDEFNLPAPVIYNGSNKQIEQIGVQPDGFFSRIPFCSLKQWKKIGPMIPIHYYSDNFFSWRAREAGFETIEVKTYAFMHHWAQAGRYKGDRMTADHALYEKYKAEGYEAPSWSS